jgi:hypothetical protein
VPPGGSAWAIAIDDQPVNVPTSSTRRGRFRRTTNARNEPSSGPTIICGVSCVASVSAASRRNSSPGGDECASA